MNKYRKISFTMQRTSSYGRYTITAKYKGKVITAVTTDSEAFDYYNDDSNKKKHREALRHCYTKIVEAYERRVI
jgi:SPX domain protein involved in polyphosphate accumulation